ncbi:hypothetical protein QOZ80_UnG0722830 [Eleusine coracana subsp. coracana]|uniref:FBD domain-containing protein n=1 Tax=Eleusine coracana subsp. coracana TaxID=191504 RepID=A0AAV9FYC1_ELECO|nr:hypothetical protein QOZ80_UnG0722830 [Eleusine coracana subsp. coracana]
MVCFSFFIQSRPMKNMKNVLRYNPSDPIKCLERHLKKMVLKNYDGKKPDVDFAKFFVLNAKVLKKVEFGVLNNCNDKWMANQHRRLQLHNRASEDALFTFKSDYWTTFTDNKHTHELWMSDPFDRSWCNCFPRI